MNTILERLDDAHVRIECCLILAGGLGANMDLPPALHEFLTETAPDGLLSCFPDLPPALIEDDDEFAHLQADELASWLYRTGKLGFVVQFATPLMNRGGGLCSWGAVRMAWRYGDTLEEAVAAGLAWAAECRQREQLENTAAAKGASA